MPSITSYRPQYGATRLEHGLRARFETHQSPPLQEHGLQMLATVAAAAQEKSRTSTPFLESNRPVLSGPTRIYATSMPYPYMNVDMIGACK